MFNKANEEEKKSDISQPKDLEFTGNNNPSLVKIDTGMTGDFNMKSLLDIEK